MSPAPLGLISVFFLVASISLTAVAPAATTAAPISSAAQVAPTPVKTREMVVQELQQRIQEQNRRQLEQQKQNLAARGIPEGGAKRAALPVTPPPQGAVVAPPALSTPAPSAGGNANFTLNSDDVVLFMDPLSATTEVGQNVTTTITALGLKQRGFDSVDLRLQFDPHVLKPVSVHYPDLSGHIVGQPQFEVSMQRGQIRFSAQMKSMVRFTTQPLITIVWQPLQRAETTIIELGWANQRSVLLADGTDLLESKILPRGSVVPFDLTIKEGASPIKPPFQSDKPALLFEDSALWLELDGPLGPFSKNDEFTINIHLRNPTRAEFDTVALLLRYPHKAARVLDWDKGNWIRSGVNIHDGDHEQFPFDFFQANEVVEKSGRIYYRMASTNRKLTSEGLLAQIRVQALKEDLSTDDFELVFDGDGGPRTTEISSGGKALLGANR